MKAFLAALLTAATGWQAGKKKAGTLLKLNARSEGNAAATLIYDHEEASALSGMFVCQGLNLRCIKKTIKGFNPGSKKQTCFTTAKLFF